MAGFELVASTTGLIIGVLCGLVPLWLGWRYQLYRPGVIGFAVCAFGGLAFGFFGAIPALVLSSAVVISHAYVNRQDPFTSMAALNEVSFEETRAEFFMRQMAALGRSVRVSGRALLRNKGGFIGFLGIMFFLLMTAFGPLLIEYEGAPQMARREPGANSLFQPPSAEFPLGLDWQGRSILSHIVHGGRNLIITSFQAGLMSTLIAVMLGSLAGLLGGLIDQLLSALSNFILTIPQFPLLLVLASILKFDSYVALALLLAVLNWPGLMRAVRAQVLSLRERDYVQAAMALDMGTRHIILREVFPNMVSYIAINFIFSVRAAMYAIVGLVVLGLVPIVEPDWGIMLFIGRQRGALFNPAAASMMLSPIFAIALFQLSLILFTRSLEELFNPRLRIGL